MRFQRGFTLVEVMVATGVMSIGIVAALELFSGSLRLAGASSRQTEALVLARSLIDETYWRTEVVEEHRSGEEGPYSWTLEVFPIERQLVGFDEEEPGLGLHDESEYELMEIRAIVTWTGIGGESRVELATARISEAL